MQKKLVTSTPAFGPDLANEHTGVALDFIQNTKANVSALATFTPHLIVLALLLGAVFIYL